MASTLELIPHADSSCAGRHVRILEYINGKKYSVNPSYSSYEHKSNIGMINGIVAIDKDNRDEYILELNNFLDFTSTMEGSILVPKQARQNEVVVDDVPKSMFHYGVSSQNIFIPGNNFRVPIEFHGSIPFVRARYPSD